MTPKQYNIMKRFKKELTAINERCGLFTVAAVRERINGNTTAILPIDEDDNGTIFVSNWESCRFIQVCDNGMGQFPLIIANEGHHLMYH